MIYYILVKLKMYRAARLAVKPSNEQIIMTETSSSQALNEFLLSSRARAKHLKFFQAWTKLLIKHLIETEKY